MSAGPGRACPLSFRYRPADLDRPPEADCDVLLVAGGLYGNPEALDAVLALAEAERAAGLSVRLLFNGDFHWLDADPETFQSLQRAVLAEGASAGNVEAELADPSGAGCGCGYPDYVADATVQRSNTIMARLQQAIPAAARAELAKLPMHLSASVGGRRVAVLHGDPTGLAGWSFAVERMPPPDPGLRRRLGCPEAPVTDEFTLRHWFREAGAEVFACSHTCLPFVQDFALPEGRRAVINNGSAGLPNFRGDRRGLVTRIAVTAPASGEALYGLELDGLHCHALPVAYDHEVWWRRFLLGWPAGSPAHESYARRILEGPDYTIADAARGSAGARRPFRIAAGV